MEPRTRHLPAREDPAQSFITDGPRYRPVRSMNADKHAVAARASAPDVSQISENSVPHRCGHCEIYVCICLILPETNALFPPVYIGYCKPGNIAAPYAHVTSQEHDRAVPYLQGRFCIGNVFSNREYLIVREYPDDVLG